MGSSPKHFDENDDEYLKKFESCFPAKNGDLILEVKKQPSLWDSSHLDYMSSHRKHAAWETTILAIFPDYKQLSLLQKEAIRSHMKKKWRHLRDAYTRSIKLRRKGLTNGKMCHHFELMHFLEGFISHLDKGDIRCHRKGSKTSRKFDDESDVSETDSGGGGNVTPADFEEILLPERGDDETDSDGFSPEDKVPIKPRKSTRSSTRKRATNKSKRYEDHDEIEVLPTKRIKKVKKEKDLDKHRKTNESPSNTNDDDDDKLFMLSLVPHLKRLSEVVRLETKSDILKAITQARLRNSSSLY